MPEPGPITPPEQEEVIRGVCEALALEAPPGWQQIRFEFYCTVGIDSAHFEATTEDGSKVVLVAPWAAMDPLGDLRSEMYEEDKGSWFTARIAILATGSFSVGYDYDTEPAFTPPLQADAYALDAAHFPRSPENTPAWLRAKLAEAGA